MHAASLRIQDALKNLVHQSKNRSDSEQEEGGGICWNANHTLGFLRKHDSEATEDINQSPGRSMIKLVEFRRWWKKWITDIFFKKMNNSNKISNNNDNRYNYHLLNISVSNTILIILHALSLSRVNMFYYVSGLNICRWSLKNGDEPIYLSRALCTKISRKGK